ncbi:MAG TPA: guanylate kinase [Solirubrobacterales bacterium]|nr:guanylate kinase [Solirubrobacterales bacterium]
MGKVFVITGPSGVGKGTLIELLRERLPELELSTSATTREPRPEEVHGRDYHFLSPEEFRRRLEAGDFLEHASYSGNYYGTLRSEVEERVGRCHSVVLEIEVQGARQVRDSLGDDAVLIFIAPPDEAVLRERLEGRGTDSEDAIQQRLRTAEVELAARSEFPLEVVNDDLQKAADELERLVRDELRLH